MLLTSGEAGALNQGGRLGVRLGQDRVIMLRLILMRYVYTYTIINLHGTYRRDRGTYETIEVREHI